MLTPLPLPPLCLLQACTLQAVQVLQMRKPPDEDTAAALLTQAAEAAVRGVLLHKSAQLLVRCC